MRETVEFRIPEKYAKRFLEPHDGRRIGRSVRVLEVATSDPRYEWIGQIDRQIQNEEQGFFFLGWEIHRRYSRKELESAELFHLLITSVFEPAGEECGTVYDDSTACPICGSGRKQVSNLILDLRKVPKGKDIACTIADEWIISQRLAELLLDSKMTGFELRPIQHAARYQDDPIDLGKFPTGREILRLAEEAGAPYPNWTFWVWFNRSEQRQLEERVRKEYTDYMRKRDRRRSRPVSSWYQLVITSAPVMTVAPTRFGIRPFDEDSEGLYRCPLGHISGLNLLSEVWISRATWDGSDIARTQNLVGTRRGLLVPSPLLLISPRMWRLLEVEEIKGHKVDVAHLCT